MHFINKFKWKSWRFLKKIYKNTKEMTGIDDYSVFNVFILRIFPTMFSYWNIWILNSLQQSIKQFKWQIISNICKFYIKFDVLKYKYWNMKLKKKKWKTSKWMIIWSKNSRNHTITMTDDLRINLFLWKFKQAFNYSTFYKLCLCNAHESSWGKL